MIPITILSFSIKDLKRFVVNHNGVAKACAGMLLIMLYGRPKLQNTVIFLATNFLQLVWFWFYFYKK